jgi:hypothetical protein
VAERSVPHDVLEVIEFQADACTRSGSPLYGTILHGVADDLRAGGICAALLAGRGDDPFGSALALRFMGAVHRVVLEGRAPELAVHYPSAGGDRGPDGVVQAFLEAVRQNAEEVSRRTDDGVQTNEVGRSAVLVGGYAVIAREAQLPLRVLEIGASAGLNLRWDQYAYDTGEQLSGDPASPVRFAGVWEGPPPALPAAFDVAERRGCDRSPVDATTEDGARTLLSYVWPDQVDRILRLRAAITVARRVPAEIDRAPAPEWLEAQLAAPSPGRATVVTHSIVMQYLSSGARHRARGAIEAAGRAATPEAPVAWLRMEPAGDRADLRLTTWPGGVERPLATAGYHGQPIWWSPNL